MMLLVAIGTNWYQMTQKLMLFQKVSNKVIFSKICYLILKMKNLKIITLIWTLIQTYLKPKRGKKIPRKTILKPVLKYQLIVIVILSQKERRNHLLGILMISSYPHMESTFA